MIPAWLDQVAEAYPDAVLREYKSAHVAGETVARIDHGFASVFVWFTGCATFRVTSSWDGRYNHRASAEVDTFAKLAPAIIRAIKEANRCTI